MNRNWLHTSFIGRAVRARAFLQGVQSPTLTEDALVLLAQIDDLLEALETEIRTRRVEPDGTIKELLK